MNTKTILSLNAMIAIVAVASIAMISGISEAPMVTADEEKAKGLYKMADGVQVVGTFDFRNGVEVVNIPDLNQGTEFSQTAAPSFSFNKAVTYTPLLHEAADTFWKYQSRDPTYNHMYNDFESTIDIYQDGKHIRSLQYTDCKITNYAIKTLEDKEEAYMGKGFAVIEEYTVGCTGYRPHAIDFDTMMEDMKPKPSKQLSSLDLLEQRSVWEQPTEQSNESLTPKSSRHMNSQEKLGDKAAIQEVRNGY